MVASVRFGRLLKAQGMGRVSTPLPSVPSGRGALPLQLPTTSCRARGRESRGAPRRPWGCGPGVYLDLQSHRSGRPRGAHRDAQGADSCPGPSPAAAGSPPAAANCAFSPRRSRLAPRPVSPAASPQRNRRAAPSPRTRPHRPKLNARPR